MNIEPYKLTSTDIQILEAQPPRILAEWSCALNRWQWVAELGEEEPPKDTLESDGWFHLETTRRHGLIDWIEERVGAKLVSRTWNKDMTDDEFEEWWQNRGKE